MERDESIDIAKGIGIIVVILGHCGMRGTNTFHMAFFFLVSGYFLSSKLTMKEYTKKRARQLLVPYLLGVLATMAGAVMKDICQRRYELIVSDILKWLFAGLYGKGAKGEFLIDNIHKVGAYWFLLALFWGSIIARYYLEKSYFLIIISVIAYVGYSTRQIIFLPWSIQNGMVASLFIGLGFLANKYKIFEYKISKIEFIAIISLWIFAIWNNITYSMVNLRFYYGLLNVIIAVAASYSIIIFQERLNHIIFLDAF